MNSQQKKDTQSDLKINEVRDIMQTFVRQRQWEVFHTPRNLLLAMVGQVGQLSQIFQWRGQVKQNLQNFEECDKVKVADQMADVLAYLVRLSDVCGIDLGTAFMNKMNKNMAKYPKDLVKGSSKKYTEYKLSQREQRPSEEHL